MNLYHVFYFKEDRKMMKEPIGLSVSRDLSQEQAKDNIKDFLRAFPSYGSEGFDKMEISYVRSIKDKER